MTPFGKLVRIDRPGRVLLAEAALAVPVVRVALALFPYRWVHRGIAAAGRGRPATTSERFAAERIIWAVVVVARRMPRATCLIQALAGSLLLLRHGHAATLRVGVAKNGDGTLLAHAWLESGGEAILGEPAPGALTPLPPL